MGVVDTSRQRAWSWTGLWLGAWLGCACSPMPATADVPARDGGTAGAGAFGVSGAGAANSTGGAGKPVLVPANGGAAPDAGPSPPAFPENCGVHRHCAVGVPVDVPAAFDGAPTAGSAPTLVYPFDGSMHPTNFAEITFQWRRDASQVWFRIRVEGDGADVWELYVPCAQAPVLAAPSECVQKLDAAAWSHVAGVNAGRAIRVTIAASSGPGGSVASSAPLTLRFSSDPLRGAIYYWATNLQGILRALAGSPRAEPFISPRSPANAAACAGCHAVSRDGKVIAFASGDTAYAGALQVARTDAPETPSVRAGAEHDASLMTLNADGSRALVTSHYGLVLRDTATGAVLGHVDPANFPEQKAPFFPEWSPNGEEIALTLAPVAQAPTEWSVSSGDIAVIPYNAGSFGPARIVVRGTPEVFHFYPSFSPDGQWILFASAPSGAAADGAPRTSYNQSLATLHLVHREGGRTYNLARATRLSGNSSTWPKFAPFSQRAGRLLFFSFNSKHDYGFLLKNSVRPESQRSPQLWLAGLDLDQLESGDPSLAPVWMPVQQVGQNNHLAYWATELRCGENLDCGGSASCSGGVCTPIR